MTTEIIFESATIIDSVRKAARVAPSKSGTAFDQAWGILMQVTPSDEVQCLVRATNLDVYYTEVVGCLSASGDDVAWRLPSELLAQLLGSMPIGSGKQIKFATKGANEVHITSGRMSATIRLGDVAYYTDWDMFDPEDMTVVTGLGGRIAMVEWAADASALPPLCGVWIDGEYLVATDRYKLARVPMKIEVPRPIVVPAGVLGHTLKALGDTSVAVGESEFRLMPDDYTQIKTVIYDVNLPSTKHFTDKQYPVYVELPKTQLVDMLTRASNFAKGDRGAQLKVFFGRGEVAASLHSTDNGLFGDVIEVPGQVEHKRIRINFDPKYLISAISKAPGERVTLGYDPGERDKFFYVRGDSGYECWVMPIKDTVAALANAA